MRDGILWMQIDKIIEEILSGECAYTAEKLCSSFQVWCSYFIIRSILNHVYDGEYFCDWSISLKRSKCQHSELHINVLVASFRSHNDFVWFLCTQLPNTISYRCILHMLYYKGVQILKKSSLQLHGINILLYNSHTFSLLLAKGGKSIWVY